MNPITGTLVIVAALAVLIALCAWLALDYRRYHRENERPEPLPADDVDFTEALRCRGGRLTPPAPTVSTPMLDAFRENR